MQHYWDPRVHLIPRPVVRPDEITDTERLTVSCTQTDLPAREQKMLVREWCQVLPTLGVRTLWLPTRVPQVLFDAVCQITTLEGLWIKWSAVTTIAALQGLPHLRYLHLGSSTGVKSIEPLSELAELRWLGLENLPKVHTIDPVGRLSQLGGLTLEGSMWKTWRVRTIRPLAALDGLRYLSLINLRADDETLAPLFGLRRLETLHLAEWWDSDEVAEIRRRNPALAA